MGLTQDGVDKIFFDKATQDNKNIAWLESPQEQLDMMNSMAQGQEDVFVSYSVTETAMAKLVLANIRLAQWGHETIVLRICPLNFRAFMIYY